MTLAGWESEGKGGPLQDCKLRIICLPIAIRVGEETSAKSRKSPIKKKTRRPASTYVDLRRLASTWIDLIQDSCIELVQCPVRLPDLNKYLFFWHPAWAILAPELGCNCPELTRQF